MTSSLATCIFEPMNYPERFPLLFHKRWPVRGMAYEIRAMDVGALCREFRELRRLTPKRPPTRPYFVGHNGVPSTTVSSNRREEHVAIAMCNLRRSWALGGVGDFRFLDYQVPLKARRSDQGIGKIDLLGLTNEGRLMVVELKVLGKKGGRSDPPMTALLEGLRYAAIVAANGSRIAEEIRNISALSPWELQSPAVVVLGERSWWNAWRMVPDADAAFRALGDLSANLSGQLDLTLLFAEMSDVAPTYGNRGHEPQLDRVPELRLAEICR